MGSKKPEISDLMEKITDEKKEKIKRLLSIEKDELLDKIQEKTFAYFWNEANPELGLIKDRSTPTSPCSVAAVGFGLTAIPVAIERGFVSKGEGYQRTLLTLKAFEEGKVEGKRGFYYHFVDMKTGKRSRQSELSSIDTSLFIAGALFAGEYFEDTEVEQLANKLYRKIDWKWMLNGENTLSMGWSPENGFIEARWDHFDECPIAYVLAIGSPTHPISPECWDAVDRPVKGNRIYLSREPLFVYQYPQIWVDFRDKEDAYANYWNNSKKAIEHNRNFAINNSAEYETYAEDIWGLSASDGPFGYRAYGAAEGNHDGTVTPYASISSIPYYPDWSLRAIRVMLKEYGPLVWGEYGFVSGFNVDERWFSDQYIGIDQGDIILMIENYRTGMIWKYFMRNRYIQSALKKMGFKDKKSSYAVTPGYLEKITG